MPANTQGLAPPLWKLVFICSAASFFVLPPAVAIPELLPYFHIGASAAEGLVSWALFGYAIGPLIYAPIANCLGRIRALYIEFSIALIGTLLSYIAFCFL